mgnify:FL=1
MAREERKKEDLYIKEKRRATNFFITGSNVKGGATKTTISSSVLIEMSESFSKGEHLTDNHSREMNGGLLYMLQEMQSDIDDVYNEVSASSFQASFFPFATLDTGSIGIISSSLIPNKDNTYDLGSSDKNWNDLHSSGRLIYDIKTFGAGDDSPSVSGGTIFKTANTAKATGVITNFDNGVSGQQITILVSDNFTDFIHSTKKLILNGAANWTAAALGDVITFTHNGSMFVETSRSDNT